jgi:hypothetical protein
LLSVGTRGGDCHPPTAVLSAIGRVKISIHPRDSVTRIGTIGRSAEIGVRRNMFLFMISWGVELRYKFCWRTRLMI